MWWEWEYAEYDPPHQDSWHCTGQYVGAIPLSVPRLKNAGTLWRDPLTRCLVPIPVKEKIKPREKMLHCLFKRGKELEAAILATEAAL